MFTEDKFDYDRKRDKGEAMINLDKPVGANGGDSRIVLVQVTRIQPVRPVSNRRGVEFHLVL